MWSSSSKRSGRRFWNTSPSLRQLHRNEDVSPVVGRGGDDGTQATDAPGVSRSQREQSDPGSPEDGRGGQDEQEDGWQEEEEEHSDCASPRAAPSFPGSVRMNSCQERLLS